MCAIVVAGSRVLLTPRGIVTLEEIHLSGEAVHPLNLLRNTPPARYALIPPRPCRTKNNKLVVCCAITQNIFTAFYSTLRQWRYSTILLLPWTRKQQAYTKPPTWKHRARELLWNWYVIVFFFLRCELLDFIFIVLRNGKLRCNVLQMFPSQIEFSLFIPY